MAAHFAGHIAVADEHELRTHLPACPSCRRFYNRYLALSRVDPRAPGPRERLAAALGLRAAATHRDRSGAARQRAWAMPAFAALVLIGVGVGVGVRSRQRPSMPGHSQPASGPAFAARGGGALTLPALLAYRVPRGGTARLVDGAVAHDDELAFAYTNAAAWPYLMVFGVDEHAHIYWYDPLWLTDAAPPAAVAARPGLGPFELPSAVRHALDGRRLVVYAIFLRRALGVDAIERTVAQAAAPDRRNAFDFDEALARTLGDVQIVRRSFEVAP